MEQDILQVGEFLSTGSVQSEFNWTHVRSALEGLLYMIAVAKVSTLYACVRIYVLTII